MVPTQFIRSLEDSFQCPLCRKLRVLLEWPELASVTGAERDALVDRAIDAERNAYIKATSVSSPPADEMIDLYPH